MDDETIEAAGQRDVRHHLDIAGMVGIGPLAVTIDLMKGQHDTHPDGTLTHIDIRRLRRSDGLLAACRRLIVLRSLRLTLWPWDIDIARVKAKEAVAREAMLQKKSVREYALAESSLRRALSRIRIKDADNNGL